MYPQCGRSRTLTKLSCAMSPLDPPSCCVRCRMTELSCGMTIPGLALGPTIATLIRLRGGLEVQTATRNLVGLARILVVDDEDRILNFVSRGLRGQGYVVDTANNGTQGLRALASTRYDLVILDLLMPEVDGEYVLRRVMEF